MLAFDDVRRLSNEIPFVTEDGTLSFEMQKKWWEEHGVDYAGVQEFCAGQAEIFLLYLAKLGEQREHDAFTFLASSIAAALDTGILVGYLLALEARKEANEPTMR